MARGVQIKETRSLALGCSLSSLPVVHPWATELRLEVATTSGTRVEVEPPCETGNPMAL